MQMIQFKSQLMDYLKSIDYKIKDPNDMHIAVESLIFTPKDKLILEKRGRMVMDEVGKLEGVGGSIGQHVDLHKALKERIENELGESVDVKICELLEVRLVNFENLDRGMIEWIIVSYLCQLVKGEPVISELDMIAELKELTVEEFLQYKEADLSQSTIIARKTYQKQYGSKVFYA